MHTNVSIPLWYARLTSLHFLIKHPKYIYPYSPNPVADIVVGMIVTCVVFLLLVTLTMGGFYLSAKTQLLKRVYPPWSYLSLIPTVCARVFNSVSLDGIHREVTVVVNDWVGDVFTKFSMNDDSKHVSVSTAHVGLLYNTVYNVILIHDLRIR